MEADIARFYRALEAAQIPRRHAHSHAPSMPVDQWAYDAQIAEMCGGDVPSAPSWRRLLRATFAPVIFERPDTFRDVRTPEEEAVLEEAAAACVAMLDGVEQRPSGRQQRHKNAQQLAAAQCRLEASENTALPSATDGNITRQF